jgi:3-oxoacyl-[acyl-carrier protein] reductase
MSGLLQGRCAIVTGAAHGLGLEIAAQYVQQGAHVVICGRQAASLAQAHERLLALRQTGQSVEVIQGDVSVPADVERIVEQTVQGLGRVDVLVNNAGIYGPKGLAEEVDWAQWVETIQVNLMGAVLMCRAIVPLMRAAGSGKIIHLSGGGATAPLPRLSAYAASKAAAIRFMETLAEELRDSGVDVNAIAPGALNTRMLDEILQAGPALVGQAFYDKAVQQHSSGGTPLVRGAALAVFLASSQSDGITGKLISAVWDPWENLDQHREELTASDIYTLRRIVPLDRGLDWGDR